MKPTLVTCRYCKTKIDKTLAFKASGSIYYCCENHYLSALEKQKQKGNHSYKSPQGTDRRDYTDFLLGVYLEEGFNKNYPNWQIIMSQTNNILKNNPNWTYETIKYIVSYMKDILSMRLITQEGNWSPLSLVEFYSKDAENYWIECNEISESIENFNFDNNSVIIKNSSNNKRKHKELSFDD